MSLTLRVSIGLIAGLLLGLIISTSHATWLTRLPALLEPVGDLFVNAIRVAAIPLVVSSLIAGIVKTGDDPRNIRKLGARALVLIIVTLLSASVFSLAIALPTFSHLHIDPTVVARLNQSLAVREAQAQPPSLARWFGDLVPPNVFKAAADGALLPLVVVSVAFGTALTQVERAHRATLAQVFQAIADALLVIVGYVVRFAPFGTFALAVPFAARMGIAAAGALAFYVGTLSAVLAAFIVVVLYPAGILLGRVPFRRFATAALPAQSIALASRASMAALPAAYEGARALALSEDVYSFFLPLGASIFRAGSLITETVGALFLAKLYGVELHPSQLVTLALAAVATSLTVPGVPGGGIIVMAPLLAALNLPAAGIGILLAVNPVPDTLSTTANVTGWLCASTILGRQTAMRPLPKGFSASP